MSTKSDGPIWSSRDIDSDGNKTGAIELSGVGARRQGRKDMPPSENVGLKPILEYKAKERLYVPPEFQRLVNMGHVNKILSTFDYAYVHPIHTGPENDRGFPIIDGQHEWLAALRHPKVDEVPLAIAYWADTIAKQADIFVKLNHNRINITAPGIFYARVAQGDEESVWMDRILTEAGCKMSRVISGNLPPLTTCAIGTLKKLRPLEDALARGLSLMARAWPNHSGAFQAAMIEGITKFLSLQGKNNLDENRLHQILMKLSSADESAEARRRAREFNISSARAIVDLLTNLYNERLSMAKQLPPVRWVRGGVAAV